MKTPAAEHTKPGGAAHSEHADRPVELANVPAAQGNMSEPTHAEPTGQSEQALVVPPGLYWPGAHRVQLPQLVCPAPANVSTPHLCMTEPEHALPPEQTEQDPVVWLQK